MQYKWTKTAETVVYPKLQLLFCASIITRNKWRYMVIIYFPTTMSLIALVIELLWMLLSTATEAEIRVTVVHDSFVRTGHLTSSVGCMVTMVVVKRVNDHSVLCGLAFLAVDWNLCVTVAVNSLGTNLSRSLPLNGVSGHHAICPGTRSSWSSATSAGSGSRHVERLPRQVVGKVLIITCCEKVVAQAAIAVKQSEARRLPAFASSAFRWATWKDSKNEKQNLENERNVNLLLLTNFLTNSLLCSCCSF